MRLIILLLTFSFHFSGLTQDIPEGEFFRRMDLGEDLMYQGKYDEADEEFRFVMDNKKVLPSNMAYLFGRNSYHLGNYKQGINWLNKYIQLKGTKGRYYQEAVKFLHLAEDQYLAVQRANAKPIVSDLEESSYDCGGLEKMICPVCRGDGVIITRGAFGATYKTCPYSAGEGYLTCEEYNLFMSGMLEPKIQN